jgi:carbon storage regulator CsrA
VLILNRKKHEQIVIKIGGEMVVVRVVDVGRGAVRLGIIAPESVAVYREEIARRMEDWQKELDALLGDLVQAPAP